MDKKILVVDDDAMNLRLAEKFLKKSGYQVVQAHSGEECLIKLKYENVDLILLDIEMPGLNGIQTIQKIRQENLAVRTPICFLSASESQEIKEAGKKYGADGFLSKPFLPASLIETVEKYLVPEVPL